ncbi:hypothetical protein, partial [Streptomyces sp. NPDC055287]
ATPTAPTIRTTTPGKWNPAPTRRDNRAANLPLPTSLDSCLEWHDGTPAVQLHRSPPPRHQLTA